MKNNNEAPKVKNIIKTKQIPLSAFLDETKYLENPRQRDHSKRLKKPHLNGQVSPAQMVVSAVKVGKEFYLLDGHSRREAWKTGRLQKVDNVTMTYFEGTAEDITEVYTHYDSKTALETPNDRASGNKKYVGFEAKSVFMNKAIKQALSYASKQLGLDLGGEASAVELEQMKFFLVAMQEIDSMEYVPLKFEKGDVRKGEEGRKFSAGVKASMLVAFHEDAESACEFFAEYVHEDEDSYLEGMVSALQAVKASGRGQQVDRQNMKLILTAFRNFQLEA